MTSSCLALQLWYSLGLLNSSFPFEAILDLSCPFYEFHLLQVVPDIVFPSGLGSSYWSSCEWFPFVYFLYNTSFRHSICVSKPTQSLGFDTIYYFRCFIQSSNCMFVLILQLPLSSSVGPNIFLSIYLSNTDSLCITLL